MKRILHLNYTQETLLIAFAALTGVVLYALLCKRGQIGKRWRHIGLWLYGVVILWYTLLSRKRGFVVLLRYRVLHEYRNALARFLFYNSDKPICAWRITGVFREMVLNVQLFIPFGCLLQGAMPDWKLRKLALIGFAVSLVVECLQLVTVRGTFDLCDLINNSLGTLVGALLCKAMLRGDSH